MNVLESFKGLPQKKFTPLYWILFLIIATFVIRTVWMKSHSMKFSRILDQVESYIETGIANRKPVSDAEILSLVQPEARLGFLAYSNQLDKAKISILNQKYSDTYLSTLTQFSKTHNRDETFAKMIGSPLEFSGPYLKIIDRPVYQVIKDQKVKVGQIVAAFVLPGEINQVPQSGAYYDTFYKGWILFLLAHVMVYPLYIRRRKKAEPVKIVSKKDQLEWLEQKLDDIPDDDTTRENIIPSKVGWTELFNRQDLKDWHVKGEWYVKDQLAIGFPWGSSIVTQYEIPYEKYEYELEGHRASGPEGFIVLFRSRGIQLVWVLGGWKNTRSEVVGYPQTVTSDKIEKMRWYYVKIESDTDRLVGFLDGRQIWEIQKKDLVPLKEEMGFQNGFGVGIWSSMARFQRIRIVSTE